MKVYEFIWKCEHLYSNLKDQCETAYHDLKYMFMNLNIDTIVYFFVFLFFFSLFCTFISNYFYKHDDNLIIDDEYCDDDIC